MILPIIAYGDPVLRRKSIEIESGYEGLHQLIQNMFDTMDNAHGVGLAAPQIGLNIRLFIVDTKKVLDDKDDEDRERFKGETGIQQAFLNATIIESYHEPWVYEEGCLSIPGIREDVSREGTIRISYQDEHFNNHEKEFSGLAARVIQHEYDHIEGILFIDKISPLKKRMLNGRLEDISTGRTKVDYKMKFPTAVRRR